MIKTIVKKNEYRDSVFLMVISEKIQQLEGVDQVVVVMGTEMNKTILTDSNMYSDATKEATPNDLIIAIEAKNEDIVNRVLSKLNEIMKQNVKESKKKKKYSTLELALKGFPEANLAMISVPGEYAAAEAKKAIKNGLHTFIFSDNVNLEEELEIKKLARKKDLLVMGPDCGTSVINNISLGMMSAVRKGPVGLVGASGAGIHEISIILDKQGVGISQAIGTGGRDLSETVGGITMIQGIEFLEQDNETEVIVLVSRPPAKNTMEKVLEVVKGCQKPVIIDFLGGEKKAIEKAGAIPASTLEEAAMRAVYYVMGEEYPNNILRKTALKMQELVTTIKKKFDPGQKYIRGLLSGATHCEESILILQDYLEEIFSNISLPGVKLLHNVNTSEQNTLIDIGGEEFTRGRPHPVIEPVTLRDKIIKEGSDPEVAVILFDLYLGYGAHPDPAGKIIEAIASVKNKAEQEGRYLCAIASICGTYKDFQNLSLQEKKLKDAGVMIMPSNARATLLSELIIK